MKRNQFGLFPSLNTFLDDFFTRGFLDIDQIYRVNAIPAANVKEDEHAYTLELAVPGFKKEDFSIEVKDGYLKIASKLAENNEEKDEQGGYKRREFVQRTFARSFQLPDHVDAKAIVANYKSGILALTLPKVEKKDDRILIDIA
ncbi:MAG: Hsp20/alpha crystallin family protein [Bacteroidia bacterium]|nr:Hsp20/alpha crystallin family protein [Bacteroidia bacterium]